MEVFVIEIVVVAARISTNTFHFISFVIQFVTEKVVD